MNVFFQRLTDRLRRFMYGRYGMDALSTFLLITGIVLTLLSTVRQLAWLAFPALFLIILVYARSLSRKLDKRLRELNKYLRLRRNVRERYALVRRIFRERKTHKFFKCKLCKTRLRVPRGRGKIEITCPKCRARAIKKT